MAQKKSRQPALKPALAGFKPINSKELFYISFV